VGADLEAARDLRALRGCLMKQGNDQIGDSHPGFRGEWAVKS